MNHSLIKHLKQVAFGAFLLSGATYYLSNNRERIVEKFKEGADKLADEQFTWENESFWNELRNRPDNTTTDTTD